jgi:hypothetical protein
MVEYALLKQKAGEWGFFHEYSKMFYAISVNQEKEAKHYICYISVKKYTTGAMGCQRFFLKKIEQNFFLLVYF